jgi:hypothetical protein
VNLKNNGGMELEALKSGINSRLEQPVTSRSPLVIRRLPRSKGVLMKLRRNLWLETAMYVLSIPVMVFEAWRIEEMSLSIYLLTCSVIMCVLVPFFFKLARRITSHIKADTTVHEGLKELLDIMKTYQKRYLQFNIIMVPLCLVYAIVLVIAFPGSDAEDLSTEANHLQAWKIWLMFLGSLSFLMVTTWLLAKWWIHWLYGQYIKNLEQELNEVASMDE